MPDFTMCATPDCPKAAQCRRSPASGTEPKIEAQAWAYYPSWRCNDPTDDGFAFWPLFGTQGEIR